MPKLDKYVRIAEAVEYLGVCRNTLCNREQAGKIPVLRYPINNYRLYDQTDLDELLEWLRRTANDWQPPNQPR